MSQPVITVDHLWKQYGLPIPVLRKRRPWPLRDVTFSVAKGETVGIIGRNGAGKSTLLKVLAGVTPATRGSVRVQGRVFSMIELNAGLHPELTGRENARLLGAIMGLPRREMDSRMPAIEDYCEIGEWFDRPVRMYSSGMLARIGFAVAVNVDADVLLVDEVLAVGDLAFQRKCYDRIANLRGQGATILLVSHSLRQVERLCDRAFLFERGEVIEEGPTNRVVDAYFSQTMEAERIETASEPARIEGVDGVELLRAEFQDRNGEAIDGIRVGDPLRVLLDVRFREPTVRPIVAIGFVTSDMLLVGAVGNEFDGSRCDAAGVTRYVCALPEVPLLPGIYALRVKVRDAGSALLLAADRAAVLKVEAAGDMRHGLDAAGLIRLRAAWETTEGWVE